MFPLLLPALLGGDSWSFGDFGKMVFSEGTAGSGPSYAFTYGEPRRMGVSGPALVHSRIDV